MKFTVARTPPGASSWSSVQDADIVSEVVHASQDMSVKVDTNPEPADLRSVAAEDLDDDHKADDECVTIPLAKVICYAE